MYVLGFVIMWCCVYLFFEFYRENEQMTTGETLAYAILGRPGFVIGLLLIIYPAFLGKCRFLRAVLGFELFACFSKATFAAYMFHPIIVSFYFASLQESMYFSGYKLAMFGIDNFALTYFFSCIIAIVIEYPCTLLSKEFLRPAKRQPIPKAGQVPKIEERKADTKEGT